MPPYIYHNFPIQLSMLSLFIYPSNKICSNPSTYYLVIGLSQSTFTFWKMVLTNLFADQ